MIWADIDCATNCPFREDGLCDYGSGNYSMAFVPDPICAAYEFDENDDVDELYERVSGEVNCKRQRVYDEREREDTAKKARAVKRELVLDRRRETQTATIYETRRIKQIDKRLNAYRSILNFADNFRAAMSMTNDVYSGTTKTPYDSVVEELSKLPEYAALVAERTELVVRKETILRQLREKRKQQKC